MIARCKMCVNIEPEEMPLIVDILNTDYLFHNINVPKKYFNRELPY